MSMKIARPTKPTGFKRFVTELHWLTNLTVSGIWKGIKPKLKRAKVLCICTVAGIAGALGLLMLVIAVAVIEHQGEDSGFGHGF